MQYRGRVKGKEASNAYVVAHRYYGSSQKQVETGLTSVTRENIEQPDIEKYLYKAEC